MMKTIVAVDAKYMPNDVLDYCLNGDIGVHYQNDIVWIENDGNPFSKWLISQGYVFSDAGGYIGIFAT